MSTLRFAVVGLGYWGPNLVRNLHELPEAEVVAICDRRPEALDMDVAYARNWSLGLDLWLLVRTPFEILRRTGTT